MPILAWIVLGVCALLAGLSGLYCWAYSTMSVFRPKAWKWSR